MIGKLNSRDHAYVVAVDYQTSLFFIYMYFFFCYAGYQLRLCVTVLPETQDPNNNRNPTYYYYY